MQFFSFTASKSEQRPNFLSLIHCAIQPKIMNRSKSYFVCAKTFDNNELFQLSFVWTGNDGCNRAHRIQRTNVPLQQKRYHFYWHRFQWHRHVLFVKWLCTISCCDTCIGALNVRDFVSRGGFLSKTSSFAKMHLMISNATQWIFRCHCWHWQRCRIYLRSAESISRFRCKKTKFAGIILSVAIFIHLLPFR